VDERQRNPAPVTDIADITGVRDPSDVSGVKNPSDITGVSAGSGPAAGSLPRARALRGDELSPLERELLADEFPEYAASRGADGLPARNDAPLPEDAAPEDSAIAGDIPDDSGKLARDLALLDGDDLPERGEQSDM
jgi:hypothetical protein